ncbi:hypothetical protein PFAS1_21675 [Pseudomonas frederiksbergensis]|uniref:hypothetical protein n=1 Tax=Pseudomonas frederiksbergensis TaxID=104087 RepID=UPI000957D9E7|nr:hypothetical protein [Pseudomonas frederiksbergensis]APV41825.1 hypothetical protein PFAS1_21675 [Pseudomonas frederiksbergensis]
MSRRGEKYWSWYGPDLHCRIHEERLENGLLIDIQVRLTNDGDTQLFVGVYEEGAMLFEDAYLSRPGETMTQAMNWGVQRAMEFVETLNAPAKPSQPEGLPRKG